MLPNIKLFENDKIIECHIKELRMLLIYFSSGYEYKI